MAPILCRNAEWSKNNGIVNNPVTPCDQTAEEADASLHFTQRINRNLTKRIDPSAFMSKFVNGTHIDLGWKREPNKVVDLPGMYAGFFHQTQRGLPSLSRIKGVLVQNTTWNNAALSQNNWLGHLGSNQGSRDQNPMPYRLAMPQQRWTLIYASVYKSSSIYRLKICRAGIQQRRMSTFLVLPYQDLMPFITSICWLLATIRNGERQ